MLNNEVRIFGVICDKEFTIRKTGEGIEVINFCVAVGRAKDSDKTDFVDCTLFGTRVQAFINYASKGTLIQLSGRLQTRIDEYKEIKIKKTIVNVDEFQFVGKFDYKKNQIDESNISDEELREMLKEL